MDLKLKTKFQTRVATALTAAAVSLVVESVTDVPSAPFHILIDEGLDSEEVMLVTAVTTLTKTLTVTRAQQSSTAVVHAVGALVTHSEIDAEELNRLQDMVQAKKITFTESETASGTYTGSVTIPAGSYLVNVIVYAEALWDSDTSAAMIVGDAADPNGFFDAVNLKATDLLAGEAIDFGHTGGCEGADVDAPAAAVAVRRRYLATERVITGEITTVSGTGSAGITHMIVLFVAPKSSEAATYAA